MSKSPWILRQFFVALLLFLSGEATLIWLGVWQVERLGEKEAQIAAIEKSWEKPALKLSPSQLTPDLWESEPLRRVEIEGLWLPSAPVRANFLLKKPLKSETGASYRLIAPLQVGSKVLIVDLGYTLKDERPSDITATGAATLRGRLWPSEKSGLLTLPDAEKQRLLFTLNAQKAAEWFDLETPFPGLLRLTEPPLGVSPLEGLSIDNLPIAKPPNNHLEYAITWLSLAVIWLVLFGYWLWLRKREAEL